MAKKLFSIFRPLRDKVNRKYNVIAVITVIPLIVIVFYAYKAEHIWIGTVYTIFWNLVYLYHRAWEYYHFIYDMIDQHIQYYTQYINLSV